MRTYFRPTLFVLGTSVLWVACDQERAAEPRATPVASNKLAAEQTALAAAHVLEGQLLPTGARITPEATPGAHFQGLNPGLSTLPDQLVDQ